MINLGTFEPGGEEASVIGLGIGELEPQKAFFKDCPIGVMDVIQYTYVYLFN